MGHTTSGHAEPEPLVGRVEDASRVACELHIEGTHSGPLPTPDGALMTQLGLVEQADG